MQAAQAAAAAAALVNSKLGVAAGAATAGGGPEFPVPQSENITVPDRLVGLRESLTDASK